MSLINQWRDKSSAKFIPLQASLELTNRCNERCTHCYIDSFYDDPKKTLSFEQWQNILLKLKRAGTLYLVLMGGEAMLNPHFFNILDYASKLGLSVSMISNGMKIKTLETAKKLKELGLSNITFSIYSLDDKIHDNMTKVRGSLRLTLQALQFCRTVGITTGVNCLLTKENIDSYFTLAEWCIEQKMEIKADPHITPKFSGDKSPTYLRPSGEQLTRYYQTVVKKWPRGLPQVSWENNKEYLCNIAKGKCAVTAYGELLGCLEVRESLGNLVHNDFASLWFSDKATKWRETRNSHVQYSSDKKSNKFCEHCLGIAQHETGNAFKATEFSEQIASIKMLTAATQQPQTQWD